MPSTPRLMVNDDGTLVDAVSGRTFGASLPAGVVVMWSGLLVNIPVGWALCDGGGGRPDLRDRFIKGTAAGVDPGATGGAASHTPTGTVSQPTFSGSALATHQHELPVQKVAGGIGVLRLLPSSVFGVGTSRAAESVTASPLADTTSAAVDLSEAVSAGTPSGTVSQPTFTGSSQNTEPAFYALAFIIKT